MVIYLIDLLFNLQAQQALEEAMLGQDMRSSKEEAKILMELIQQLVEEFQGCKWQFKKI